MLSHFGVLKSNTTVVTSALITVSALNVLICAKMFWPWKKFVLLRVNCFSLRVSSSWPRPAPLLVLSSAT